MKRLRTQQALNPREWYRVAVTFNGTTPILYVNGVAAATAPVVTPFEWTAPNLRFGADEVSFGELRVWTTVRTPAQILAGLNNITAPQAGLAVLYKFRDGAGATVADASTHGRDAGLSGSWQWETGAEQPRMAIARSGQSVVISWPASFSGFVLEATRNLTPPIDWTEATDLPPAKVVNGQNAVTVSQPAGQRFFRLRLAVAPSLKLQGQGSRATIPSMANAF